MASPYPLIASHADSVKAYLATVPGLAFRAPGDLVQFESNVTVDTALDAMNEADISGAPVYDGTPFFEQLSDTVRPRGGCGGHGRG